MPGLTVVVSPLISLMKDQVDALAECGVEAARIDSTQSAAEQKAVFTRINERTLKLLYLAPERLVSDGFVEFLKKSDLSLIAVDEAHCVSMWGHDFRPEYRQLGFLKEAFAGIAIHAYTATATEQVRLDIARQLRLKKPEILVGSFDRANLVYRVERRADIIEQVCDALDRHKDESGIIYCIRRADVDDMCVVLSQRGYKVLPYHAGMENEDRKKNQESFIEEKVDTIVATIAFGMGIDKSNVRYVIHAGMPKSLENYQQESGRAGRDNLEAECWLFYSGGDYGIWKYLQRDMEPEPKRIAMSKLNDIYDYCTGVTCRHHAIIKYFDQALDGDNCGACDVCLGSLACMEDSLKTSQKILSCIVRLDERFGADYTSSVLTGSREKRILEYGHEKLSTYGVLSGFTQRIARDWVEQLASQGYLQKTGEYNVLNVTKQGWRVIKGEETPRLLKPSDKPASVDNELFEALRKLRREIADGKEVPAFVVFSDATLRDMARRRPSTPEKFLEVTGVGEKKSQQYCGAFLPAIEEYYRTNSIRIDAAPPTLSKARQDSFHLFAQGLSIEQVARSIGRAESTTCQYLVEHIQRENIDNPSPWVDEKTFQRVTDAARQTGDDRLKPIFEFLNSDVDYNQIRISMACIRDKK